MLLKWILCLWWNYGTIHVCWDMSTHSLFFILNICIRSRLNSVWHTDVLLSMKKFCPWYLNWVKVLNSSSVLGVSVYFTGCCQFRDPWFKQKLYPLNQFPYAYVTHYSIHNVHLFLLITWLFLVSHYILLMCLKLPLVFCVFPFTCVLFLIVLIQNSSYSAFAPHKSMYRG